VAVAALTKAGGMAIEASNSNFGDPANGHVKMLRVDYQVNGVGHSKTVPEGETLTISALSAPPAIADSICAVIPAAQGDARLAILRSLRMAGGPRALQAIRDAAASGDPRIKDMALRVLCDWNTPDALPSIIEVVATPPTKTLKILAMRGLVRLVPLDNATDAKKINTLKTAMTMADRDEERQLVLSALGNVPTTEALMLAAAQLENPVLREEACVAAVAIAEKVAHRGDAQVVKVMQRVAKLTNNRELATRAAALAK
jgi:HEAT repeat protein